MKRQILTPFFAILMAAVLPFGAAAQKKQDPEIARLNAALAASYNARQFDAAIATSTQLTALYVKRFGKDDIHVARQLKNTGLIYIAKGETVKAEQPLEDGRMVFMKHPDLSKDDAAAFAGLLETLAGIRSSRDLASGRNYLEQAIAWREKSGGFDSPLLVEPLAALANIKYWARQYADAAATYKRAMNVVVTTNAVLPTDTRAIVYSRTQCSYRKAGIEPQFDELKSLYNSRYSTAAVGVGQRTITGGVLNGRATHLATPPYPEDAKRRRVSGTVSVQVLIDEKGLVLTACSLPDADLTLAEASEIAALASTFAPATFEGSPVKVSGVITYNFRTSAP